MKFLKEKVTISETKISVDGINGRLKSSEEKIRELSIIAIKNRKIKERKKKV